MRNSFRFFIIAIALVSAIACGGGGSPAANTYYLDADGDTYGSAANTTTAASAPTGYVTNDDDCDDANATINPSATEIYDSVDNDCDGSTDEGFFTFYKDGDLDGYGDAANTTVAASAPSGARSQSPTRAA